MKSLNLEIQPEGPPKTMKTEESASHHLLMFAFAQLRAEMTENDAGEARRLPEIMKNCNLGNTGKLTMISEPTDYNC